MVRSFALLTTLLGAALALAQADAIRWRTDPHQAVAEAQRTLRPLMVYVLPSTKDRDNDLEREHRAALRDPRVLWQARNFIPLRLSRSQHREVLHEFGHRISANMEMSFVTPDGVILGTLGANGVGQAASLAQKLTLSFAAFRAKLYEKDVRPPLVKRDAKPGELKQALRLVVELRIVEAEPDVIALLERKRLAKSVVKLIYDALATLSTPDAVAKLLELSARGIEQATKALADCTAVGAEMMLPELKADAPKFNYPVYQAVTRICDIRSTKAERYFEKAKLKLKEREIERVSELVKEAAARWRETYDEPR